MVPPFEVRPSMFELRRDSSMLLEVLFAPTALEEYSQSIAIVCDNCQVKYFNITGEVTAPRSDKLCVCVCVSECVWVWVWVWLLNY